MKLSELKSEQKQLKGIFDKYSRDKELLKEIIKNQNEKLEEMFYHAELENKTLEKNLSDLNTLPAQDTSQNDVQFENIIAHNEQLQISNEKLKKSLETKNLKFNDQKKLEIQQLNILNIDKQTQQNHREILELSALYFKRCDRTQNKKQSLYQELYELKNEYIEFQNQMKESDAIKDAQMNLLTHDSKTFWSDTDNTNNQITNPNSSTPRFVKLMKLNTWEDKHQFQSNDHMLNLDD